LPPRDVVLSDRAWDDLKRVNDWVNHTIKPETDMDHYGMIEWWRYPDDGIGACHSYALLKRRMLIKAGWPRTALLMTIVHEANGEGHAVLTVKTDRGEYILDNLEDRILLWSETPYRFYKRQSQSDPNVWVWLNDVRYTAAIRTSSLR
jgi:predicted transglutaminase-like cysteine proteinase